jgi:thioredoxin-like negative regulator of GroEL/tRNA A-37 threonylcarbamoyl transferase component Bud32
MDDERRNSGSDDSLATFILTPSGRLGRVYADRFRIERFLGSGAYGEVFEAHDQHLDQRVAIKLLRADLDRDRALLERFRREVRTARQVSHPNVCRVHDLFEHREASNDGDPRVIQLLSMELLTGETLADRIGRLGPLRDEVLPLVARQLAAGLDAAHAAGVLHRDFKSGNVLIVASSRGLRAVITDFGLARGALDGLDRGTLTEAGTVLGSPAYMAPEQVRGEATTAASDLYSFGVVLYEMVSGELPFRGESPLQTALVRLHQAPTPPSQLVSGIEPAWEEAILACLELDPAKRPRSAAEAVEAVAPLGALASGGSWSRISGRSKSRSGLRAGWRRLGPLARLGSVLAALALVAGLAAGYWAWRGEAWVPPPGGEAGGRLAIAVVGLENLSHQPDLAYIDHALSELLPMEIAGGDVRVVPSEQVRRARTDLGISLAGSLSTESLARLRRLTGANRVVVGSYLANPGAAGARNLRFDVVVQDADRGTVLTRFRQDANEAALLGAVESLGATLRTALGGAELTASEAQEVAATRPRSPAGIQTYAEGLARLRVADAPGALKLLERAAQAEPDNPLVHAALARAWLALGFDRRALEESNRAMSLAGNLPEMQRWEIEARYRGLAREHEAAIALYQKLVAAEPDDVDHLLDLANAQITAHRGADARATIARLRALREPERNDPRIDLTEGREASGVGDYPRLLASADRAVAQGDELGAKLIAARGHIWRAIALRQLGRSPEAAAAAEKARGLCEAAEDYATASLAQMEIASVRMLAGDLATARVEYQRAAELGRRAENRSAVALALNGLAVSSRRAGQLVEAERAFGDLERTYQELGDRFGEAVASNGLALVHLLAGRLDTAARRLEQAREVFESLGSRTGEAATILNLASLRAVGGELGEARKLADLAVVRFQELSEEGGVAEAQLLLGRLAAWQDQVTEARTVLIAASERAEAAGELGPVATGRMDLARLDLESGAAAEAVEWAARAVAAARQEATLAGEARALLARCLVAAGRREEAQREVASLKAEGRPAAILSRLELARADAALETPDQARALLSAARDDARAAHLPGEEFSLRLTLAELSPAAARQDAVALERAARESGFLALARRAASLSRN